MVQLPDMTYLQVTLFSFLTTVISIVITITQALVMCVLQGWK